MADEPSKRIRGKSSPEDKKAVLMEKDSKKDTKGTKKDNVTKKDKVTKKDGKTTKKDSKTGTEKAMVRQGPSGKSKVQENLKEAEKAKVD